MNYQELLVEADESSVEVGKSTAITFTKDGEATMFRTNGQWTGVSADHNGSKISKYGTKAAVANWCIDIAVNGPI